MNFLLNEYSFYIIFIALITESLQCYFFIPSFSLLSI